MNHALKYTKAGGAALVALAAALLQPLAQAQSVPAPGASAMPGMSKSTTCSDAGDNDEIQRLRADLATLRRDLNIKGSANNTSADSDPTVKPH